MKLTIVSTKKQLEDAYSVRKSVFVQEQQVSEEEEIDQYEKESTHLVVYDKDQPVGAGRFRIIDDVGKAERVCVLPFFRKKGVGQLLMNGIEELAKEHHLTKVKLNAQTHAELFYEKIGYQTVSDVFMDAGIPHVTMIKEL